MHNEQIERAIRLSSGNGATIDRQLHDIRSYRSVFISDVHLGSKGCKAAELVGFLNHIRVERIYLVGDIVDGIQFGIRGLHHIGRLFPRRPAVAPFPQKYLDVLQKLLRHARAGAFIYYIPGNHDHFVRQYVTSLPDLPEREIDRRLDCAASGRDATYPQSLFAPGKLAPAPEVTGLLQELRRTGNIVFVSDVIHKTVYNQRLYVSHGDQFDALARGSILLRNLGPIFRGWVHKGLDRLGTHAREALFHGSDWLSRNLKQDFSLARYAQEFKSESDLLLPELAVAFLDTHNELLARKRQMHSEWQNEPRHIGGVFGHSHIPAIMRFEPNRTPERMAGVLSLPDHDSSTYYMNCGDWMNHCTALAEGHDGSFRLVRWDNDQGIVAFQPRARRVISGPILAPYSG